MGSDHVPFKGIFDSISVRVSADNSNGDRSVDGKDHSSPCPESRQIVRKGSRRMDSASHSGFSSSRYRGLLVLILGFCLISPSIAHAGNWARIANGRAVVIFDGRSKTWEIADEKGEVVVGDLSCSIEVSGVSYNTHLTGRSTVVTSGSFVDDQGRGDMIVLRSTFMDGDLEIIQNLKVHRGSPRVVIETRIKNQSNRNLSLDSVTPFYTVDESHACFPRGPIEGWKTLVEKFPFSDTPSLTQISGALKEDGYWSGALWNEHLKLGALLGVREPEHGVGEVSISRKSGELGFSISARIRLDGFVLLPEATATTNSITFRVTRNILGALRNDAVLSHPPAQGNDESPLSGWAARSLKNRPLTTEALEQELQALKPLVDYGLSTVLLDEGWQFLNQSSDDWARGDWLQEDGSCPIDLIAQAQSIRQAGLNPGLWISPFLVDDRSHAMERLSEALVTDETGTPQSPLDREAWSSHPTPPLLPSSGGSLFCIDTTAPSARFWLKEVFRRLVKDAGFNFFVLDDLGIATIQGKRRHADATSLDSLARGLDWIREEVGPETYLLGARSALFSTGTKLDGLLMSPSTTADWRWFPELLKIGARRFHAAGTGTIPHLAPLHLGQGLTRWESRSFATLHSMLGGAILLADRPTSLSSEQVDILKRILPPLGASASPVDLVREDLPRIFHLRPKDDFGHHIVALFNPLDHPVVSTISLKDIGLQPRADFLGFEYWTDSFLGCMRKEISVPLAAHGCAVISLNPAKPGVPKLLSSSRHVSQGGTDIRRNFFDPETHALFVTVDLVANEKTDLKIHVPERYHLQPMLLRPESDEAQISLRDDGLLCASLLAKKSGPLHLRLSFEEKANRGNEDPKQTSPRTNGSTLTQRGAVRRSAPVAIRGSVLHIGLATDPILPALGESGIVVESLDPRLGAAAEALVTTFLHGQGDLAADPDGSRHVFILGTNCLSYPSFPLFENPKAVLAFQRFLTRGGCVIWMPQKSTLASALGESGWMGTPRWLRESMNLSVAPALSGLTRSTFDGSNLKAPGGQWLQGNPPSTLSPIESLLGVIPEELEGDLLACPSLPVHAIGVGLTENQGHPMARGLMFPVGDENGLMFFASGGLDHLLTRFAGCVRNPSSFDRLISILRKSRTHRVELESESSLLSAVSLSPLPTGILDVGDQASRDRFSHKVETWVGNTFERFPVRGRPVADSGILYSGKESFFLPRDGLEDRDLIIASTINTHRKENGVVVFLNGKRLFEHRFSNFSGARSPGWNLEFLHIRNDELGLVDPISIELRPIGRSTGSSYRHGFFRGPDSNSSYLSDLPPLSVEPEGSGVALDRNANGGLLFSGDRIHYKGVGTHADTRVTYEIGPGFRRFQTHVGIDAEAAPAGMIRFQILLDDKLAFESAPMTKESPPVTIDLDVSHSSRITLISQDGGGTLPGELANWGDARLVK